VLLATYASLAMGQCSNLTAFGYGQTFLPRFGSQQYNFESISVSTCSEQDLVQYYVVSLGSSSAWDISICSTNDEVPDNKQNCTNVVAQKGNRGWGSFYAKDVSIANPFIRFRTSSGEVSAWGYIQVTNRAALFSKLTGVSPPAGWTRDAVAELKTRTRDPSDFSRAMSLMIYDDNSGSGSSIPAFCNDSSLCNPSDFMWCAIPFNPDVVDTLEWRSCGYNLTNLFSNCTNAWMPLTLSGNFASSSLPRDTPVVNNMIGFSTSFRLTSGRASFQQSDPLQALFVVSGPIADIKLICTPPNNGWGKK